MITSNIAGKNNVRITPAPKLMTNSGMILRVGNPRISPAAFLHSACRRNFVFCY